MIVANGSTDVTTYFVLRDSTNHAPKTDVTVTDIDLYYLEQGAAMAAKVDATALDAADSAHADNKGYHCGQGLYRIDWPDEAFNGGVGKRAYLIVVCTGVDTTFLEVELSPNVNTNSLTADVITAAGIADNAFANEHFAAGALTSAEITSAAGCVVASIANNAITAASINDGAITNAKVADDLDVNVKTMTAGVITSTIIADDAITAAKLNTGAITADAFAADAIVAATLATGAITADAFAADAIVAATLATGALTADAFAANAITNAAVADDVDVNVKTMTAGVITAAVIADGAIDAATFAAGAIDAAAIAAGAIDAATLAADMDAELRTIIWNAPTADYGGAGTYGQAVEDILADTNELQVDDYPTSIAAIKTVVDVIQADTDLLDDAAGGLADIHTDVAAVKTVVDAVQAKTDLLTFEAVTNHIEAAVQNIAADAIDETAIKNDAITAAKIAAAAIDQATFAADVYVVANVKKINNTTLTGDGGATPWGPA